MVEHFFPKPFRRSILMCSEVFLIKLMKITNNAGNCLDSFREKYSSYVDCVLKLDHQEWKVILSDGWSYVIYYAAYANFMQFLRTTPRSTYFHSVRWSTRVTHMKISNFSVSLFENSYSGDFRVFHGSQKDFGSLTLNKNTVLNLIFFLRSSFLVTPSPYCVIHSSTVTKLFLSWKPKDNESA